METMAEAQVYDLLEAAATRASLPGMLARLHEHSTRAVELEIELVQPWAPQGAAMRTIERSVIGEGVQRAVWQIDTEL